MKKQYVAVAGILIHDNKVLLVKRSLEEGFLPGQYEFPGGKLEFGESPEEGLAREFEEETHLVVAPHKLIRAFSYVVGDKYTVELVYYVRTKQVNSIQLSNAHDAYVWISYNEIDKYPLSLEIKTSLFQVFREIYHTSQ